MILKDVVVATAAGEPVALGRLIDRLTLLVLTRYYGCMPERHFLAQVREAVPDIEALGGAVIAVGTGTDFEAQILMEEGIPFPCLVDSESRLYRVLGLPRMRVSHFLDPKTLRNYRQAWGAGARQGRIGGDLLQLPGLALLDADSRVLFLHRGKRPGDYPSIPDVLVKLREEARQRETGGEELWSARSEGLEPPTF